MPRVEPSPSIQPSGAGQAENPAPASALVTSSSGFSPGSSSRNSLRMSRLPNTSEELDCSAASSRPGPRSVSVHSGVR